ncbi:MAG: transposase [Candidatus Brennerbacteria bacterium]|nr:transposase [Candidatus Brennerbacteria bacterium]
MRPKIIAGNIYHVLNRGVDKRKIFLDESDYVRFIHDLFEFNDTSRVFNFGYFVKKSNSIAVGQRYIEKDKKPRKLLVEILAFCLMPNHYHLLIKPKIDTGASEFIKKLNGGYSQFFNNKYGRSGALFQGKYKAIPATKESHFIHLPYYIHMNPLDLKFPEWRNREINNYKEIMSFLENYRWSSFMDYIGKKNFPSVTQREFLNEFLGGPEQYKKDTIKWLKDIDLKQIDDLTLES